MAVLLLPGLLLAGPLPAEMLPAGWGSVARLRAGAQQVACWSSSGRRMMSGWRLLGPRIASRFRILSMREWAAWIRGAIRLKVRR
ncbi:hypothetical protein FB475_4476 [Kribbella jejuensis]|uniref:Uncharacterized protein n=1 Tax=Kribbella jejuensis TaxID=236068 RepID=A0A542E8B0_9ACTN|nr:hypothetical protein FB475_4476 [Kribbella jejuensis]